MNELAERVFIVTGAAGGIGAATAQVLIERGALVALVDLDKAAVDARIVELGIGGQAIGLAANITKQDQVEHIVEQTIAHFGGLDGAVANAGIVHLNSAWESTPESWDKQLSVNVTGTFITASVVGAYLRTHGGGAIVNVASNCGKVGYANMAAYNASKAAVINLTRSLALEWATDAINVNAVCPGGVDTPMLGEVARWLSKRTGKSPSDLIAGMGSTQLSRRIQPAEVGAVIAFLLSDDATIIRGQAINVDGGDTPY